MSWNCRKKTSVPAALPVPAVESTIEDGPPPAITPADLPSPESIRIEPVTPTSTVVPDSFVRGDRSFQAGNFREAVALFEEFLGTHPESGDRDRALFQLGLSYALANEGGRGPRQAAAAFRRLLANFPESPYRPHAELILDLQTRIDQLSSDLKARDEKIKQLGEELRVLKEIDLQRRPSWPNE